MRHKEWGGEGLRQGEQPGRPGRGGEEAFFTGLAGLQTVTREHGPLSCSPVPGTVLALRTPPAHSCPSKGGDLCFFVPGEEVSHLSSHGPV